MKAERCEEGTEEKFEATDVYSCGLRKKDISIISWSMWSSKCWCRTAASYPEDSDKIINEGAILNSRFLVQTKQIYIGR